MGKIKKDSKPPVAYLQIKFSNNHNPKGFRIYNFKAGLKKIERYLKSVKGKWQWALLRQISTNNIFYYYHPKTGTERLDQKAYAKLLEYYSLYIIPTSRYKRQHGSLKGMTEKVRSLDEVGKFWNKDVLRIDIYQQGKLINRFMDGKFLNPCSIPKPS